MKTTVELVEIWLKEYWREDDGIYGFIKIVQADARKELIEKLSDLRRECLNFVEEHNEEDWDLYNKYKGKNEAYRDIIEKLDKILED